LFGPEKAYTSGSSLDLKNSEKQPNRKLRHLVAVNNH